MSKHETEQGIKVNDDSIDANVTYNWTPGRPEQGPSYASGGEPAEAPEVEVLDIHALNPVSKKYEQVPIWFFDIVVDQVAEQVLEDHQDAEIERDEGGH